MTLGKPIEVAVYYFPQYHPDPRNDVWHGAGWSEWELMKAARPRYHGHKQPKAPAWGYFDESDPKWAAKEIDIAADSGIDAFIYDWYQFEDGPFLQDGLDKGFLNAPNRDRIKFGIMWANHDWPSMFPARAVDRLACLVPGRVSREVFDRVADEVIERYFPRPNYWTVDGEPYFSIYEIGNLIAGLGGVDETRDAFDSFRAKTLAAGFPGLHLNVVVWGMEVLPTVVQLANPEQIVAELGVSSTTTYAWAHHYPVNSDGFPKGSYEKAAARNYEAWEEFTSRFPVPYHPNVSMGWDPSPRTCQSDLYESRGYPWTAILDGNTPEAFKAALEKAKAFVSRPECEQKIVTINAWNEWTEGSYLLPDTEHGTAYLDAIREVFGA